ncbi:hypothetical protein Q5Z34_16310 [Listeria innocua]
MENHSGKSKIKYLVKTGLKENDSINETPGVRLKDGQEVTVKQ